MDFGDETPVKTSGAVTAETVTEDKMDRWNYHVGNRPKLDFVSWGCPMYQ